MIRANVDQKYFRKFLWVFLGCTAFAAYCLYDGLVAYPKKLTIAEAYEKLPESGRRDAWKELAAKEGWPTITPAKTAEEIRHDITGQFVMILFCGLIGIPTLLKFMSGQGTWVEGDETVIRNSRGQEVPIETITRINKDKWESKGIAKIYYEVEGKKKKFIMDDFKYDRKPMGELLRFAEADLTQDQLVGDFLERDKDAFEEQQSADEAVEEEADEEELIDSREEA